MSFVLHERLQRDCLVLGAFPLSRLLFMRDSRFPWCILVPARSGICELHQLEWNDQVQLLKESNRLAGCLTRIYEPDKLNIAAIGNLVPQLHVHHVVRFRHDPAWPAPVWGVGTAVPYTRPELEKHAERLLACLGQAGIDVPAFECFVV